MTHDSGKPFGRRQFLSGAVIFPLAASACGDGCKGKPRGHAHGVGSAQSPLGERPTIPYGVQSGEVTETTAVIWSKSSRAGRMLVEWADNPAFDKPKRVQGPEVGSQHDCTGQVVLKDLPFNQKVYFRVAFQAGVVMSEWSTGETRTAPVEKRDINFLWSGDTAGQGYGIDLARGGMRIYEAMRKRAPDFFLHAGDLIYADGIIPAEIPLPDGTVWKNVTTPAKSKVAETLDDFRGNFAYNFLDENVRRFHREVPVFVTWDDHEVRNNWYPQQKLDDDPRYTEKSVSTLALRASQAMREYTPLGALASTYRDFHYGPSLQIFILDGRSYRTANDANTAETTNEHFLGSAQLQWLVNKLTTSRATWKVILCDMPLCVVVSDPPRPDGVIAMDGFANGDNGPPKGREGEIAYLLSALKKKLVKNVVFLTADVHHAAAHEYRPERAQFKEFDAFWEFVAGPLNAGSFAPGPIDSTFGPEAKFQSPAPKHGSPAEGLQFFGAVHIDGKSERLAVTLHDIDGKEVYRSEFDPLK